MMMILSRHGNTFGPKDPVVWAGAGNDLPLVEAGLQQAEKLAQRLISQSVRPQAVFCGPLQRTRKYAEIIVEKLSLPSPAIVDPRLNEVDYGEWTGLTHDQVTDRFGEAPLAAWELRSEWPTQGSWGGSSALIIAEVKSFVTDLLSRYRKNDKVLVISSNGRLRYFLTLVSGEFERRITDGSFKVKTGNLCKLVFDGAQVEIPDWNIDPNQFVV